MEELFYFSTFDLLIKTKYAQEANSLRYATHRSISIDEKKAVESYVLEEVAPKTDYYQKSPSLLLYMGVDVTLAKELKFYRVQNTLKDILDNKAMVDKEVQNVISKSLSNYYFERIGDKLIILRDFIQEDQSDEKIENVFLEISILLEAYNINSGQNIEIKDILPFQAKKFYQQFTQH